MKKSRSQILSESLRRISIESYLDNVLNFATSYIDLLKTPAKIVLDYPERYKHRIRFINDQLSYMREAIDIIKKLFDYPWYITLGMIDSLATKLSLGISDLRIEEIKRKTGISSKTRLFKARFEIRERALDVYSRRKETNNMLFSYILETAHSVLLHFCRVSTASFEEKAKQFENDVRIYATRLYGVDNREVIEGAIQQYRSVVENVRKICLQYSEPKPLDELQEIYNSLSNYLSREIRCQWS